MTQKEKGKITSKTAKYLSSPHGKYLTVIQMVQVQKTFDGWFTKLEKRITEKLGTFVAVQFLLIALGAWLGISVARIWPDQVILAVLVPAIIGIIAYYNRAFATAVFVLMLIAIFII